MRCGQKIIEQTIELSKQSTGATDTATIEFDSQK